MSDTPDAGILTEAHRAILYAVVESGTALPHLLDGFLRERVKLVDGKVRVVDERTGRVRVNPDTAIPLSVSDLLAEVRRDRELARFLWPDPPTQERSPWQT